MRRALAASIVCAGLVIAAGGVLAGYVLALVGGAIDPRAAL